MSLGVKCNTYHTCDDTYDEPYQNITHTRSSHHCVSCLYISKRRATQSLSVKSREVGNP